MLIIFKEGRYFHQIQGASRYYISKCGAIYSDNVKRLLHPSPQSKGYLQVPVTLKNGIRKALLLHRLVAQHFVYNPDPEKKKQVNHKNGNKSDCRACNLEWVTSGENNLHAHRTGLRRTAGKPVNLPIIRGFCAPAKDYLTKPRFYRFEPVSTSCSNTDANA